MFLLAFTKNVKLYDCQFDSSYTVLHHMVPFEPTLFVYLAILGSSFLPREQLFALIASPMFSLSLSLSFFLSFSLSLSLSLSHSLSLWGGVEAGARFTNV
jgi:hypothetical protein